MTLVNVQVTLSVYQIYTLARYGSFLERYDTLFARFGSFLARYGSFLARYGTRTAQYGLFYARYDPLIAQCGLVGFWNVVEGLIQGLHISSPSLTAKIS